MSQRRSIVGRRRSKSLGDLQLKDVRYYIDSSSPEDEKLKMLTRYALRMALDIAERKCKDETTANPFSQTCSQCLEDIVSAAHTLYDDITFNTRINTSLTEDYLPGYSEAKRKLEEENVRWDTLKTYYEENLQKERDIIVIPYTGSYDCEDLRKYDYSKTFDEITPIVEEKIHQIEALQDKENYLKSCQKLVNSLKQTKVECCIELYNESQDSPRTLIRKCITKV